MELVQNLEQLMRELDVSIKSLRKTGQAYAKAEMEYKIKLHEEVLRLRDEGTAIGVIDKICYGLDSVALLRYQRDCSEVVYKANLEAINAIKLKIRIVESQLQREWDNA